MQCPRVVSKQSLLLWTRRALTDSGLRPRRTLGQSFLIDPRPLRRYEKLVPEGADVYEPGPGLGVLTCTLARLARRVVAVEIDHRLAIFASKVLSAFPNVIITYGDAVTLAETVEADVIASNMPYSAASQILASSIKNNRINLIVAMVQLEVAQRIIASPGKRSYGRLSVIVNFYFRPHIDSVYPPSSFYPRPKVSSALVVLRRVKRWSGEDACFIELARCLFTWPNKLASKALRACGAEAALEPGNARVRDLSPMQIYEASKTLKKCG